MPGRLHAALCFVSIAVVFAASPASADRVVATIAAGTQPAFGGQAGNNSIPWGAQGIAVNPVTNKVYVANYGSANVTVIDGSTMTAATPVPVGNGPSGVAVNPLTNKIYVTNTTDGTVSIIDGATDTVTGTVGGLGYKPGPIAVNTLTNKVYVGSFGSGASDSLLTTIDAQNGNATTSIVYTTSAHLTALAVNAATNKIYVAGSGQLMIVDGATNATTRVTALGHPTNMLVDPATNRVFFNNGSIIVFIDGATNTVSSVTVAPATPKAAIALNPLTQTLFSADSGANTSTVFPETYTGPSPAPTVATGTTPMAVAVNPITNKAYVVNNASNNVTIIDGDVLRIVTSGGGANTTAPAGTAPIAVAVNPVTNKIYVANSGSNNVTVIDGSYDTVPDWASTRASTLGRAYRMLTGIAAGTTPSDIAVDPVSNQIYVANSGDGTVSVIDGTSSTLIPIPNTSWSYYTHPTTPVTVGTNPVAVAVNPVTHKIFVANKGSNSVSVIDGAAPGNAPATINLPQSAAPGAIAINPVTNKIYVAETGTGRVAVIDGTSLGATPGQITVGNGPSGGSAHGIAVDPSNNRVYVANYTDNTVSIIDGQTASVIGSAIGVGTQPTAIAVNPETGKVYVANGGSTFVSVIKTRSLNISVTNVSIGSPQAGVAVDAPAGKIYVAAANVAVLDSLSDTLVKTILLGGTTPQAIALDPSFGRSVVPDSLSSLHPFVLDGAALAVAATPTFTASGQNAAAANILTHKLYSTAQNTVTTAAPSFNPNVVEIDLATPPATGNNPLTLEITPFTADTTKNPSPTFTFTAFSGFSPTAPDPNAVFFQVDSLQSQLFRATATGTPGQFTGTSSQLSVGPHVVYAFATDGRESADFNPFIGAMSTYTFVVTNPTAPGAPANVSASAGNAQATVSFTPPADDGGTSILSYTVTSSPGGITAPPGSSSPITVTGLTNGTAYTFTVTATNAVGTSVPSAPSNSVTPGATPPAAPAFVNATVSSLTNSAATINVQFAAVTGATSYVIARSSMHGAFVDIATVTSNATYPDAGLPLNTTYLYKVRARNSGGDSLDSPIDAATAIAFTDPTLGPGTVVKAAHFLDLRTAVNAMRASVGLSGVIWSHTITQGLTQVAATDLQELRDGLDPARSALLLPPIVYTDSTLTPGSTVILAAHVNELRVGTQ